LNSFSEIFFNIDICKIFLKSFLTSTLYFIQNQISDSIIGVSKDDIKNPFKYQLLSQVASLYNPYRIYCFIFSIIYIYGMLKSFSDLYSSINSAKKYKNFFELFNKKINLAKKLYYYVKSIQNLNLNKIPEISYFEDKIVKNKNNLKLDYPSSYNPFNVFLREAKDVADEFSIKLKPKLFDINIKENFYKKRNCIFDFAIERFIRFFDALISKVKLYKHFNNSDELEIKFSIPEYLISNSNFINEKPVPYISNESKNSTENLYMKYILKFIEENDEISFVVYDELFASTTE
jgi:hypothetical protein